MSSHREAPEISQDPVADSTDLYAFVSTDQPDTVTLIANYIPLQAPDGGPNFYEFGDDVLYEINIDNDGDAHADITFQFRFTSVLNNPNTFLYNTGPIESLDSPNWNRRQFYSVTVVDHGSPHQIATGLPCPPCRIGPLSTHTYADLADAAVNDLPGGIKGSTWTWEQSSTWAICVRSNSFTTPSGSISPDCQSPHLGSTPRRA
jgi:hypothetical protein